MKIHFYKRKNGVQFGNLTKLHHNQWEIDIGRYVLSITF